MAIHYLNTDLDLVSANELTALTAALESRGLYSLHMAHAANGLWRASFETETQHVEPDANIVGICEVLEGLEGQMADALKECTLREFNIGYDCGSEPHSFSHELSLATLRRIVDVGATLRITLYRPDSSSA